MKGLDPEEAPEFATGLRELFHRFVDAAITVEPDVEAVEALMREQEEYLHSWALTMRLSGNAEWLRQMNESRTDVFDDTTEPITFEELRRRVS